VTQSYCDIVLPYDYSHTNMLLFIQVSLPTFCPPLRH